MRVRELIRRLSQGGQDTEVVVEMSDGTLYYVSPLHYGPETLTLKLEGRLKVCRECGHIVPAE